MSLVFNYPCHRVQATRYRTETHWHTQVRCKDGGNGAREELFCLKLNIQIIYKRSNSCFQRISHTECHIEIINEVAHSNAKTIGSRGKDVHLSSALFAWHIYTPRSWLTPGQKFYRCIFTTVVPWTSTFHTTCLFRPDSCCKPLRVLVAFKFLSHLGVGSKVDFFFLWTQVRVLSFTTMAAQI